MNKLEKRKSQLQENIASMEAEMKRMFTAKSGIKSPNSPGAKAYQNNIEALRKELASL